MKINNALYVTESSFLPSRFLRKNAFLQNFITLVGRRIFRRHCEISVNSFAKVSLSTFSQPKVLVLNKDSICCSITSNSYTLRNTKAKELGERRLCAKWLISSPTVNDFFGNQAEQSSRYFFLLNTYDW